MKLKATWPTPFLVDGDSAKDVAILQDAGKLNAIMKDGAFWKAPGTARASGVQAAQRPGGFARTGEPSRAYCFSPRKRWSARLGPLSA